MSDDRLKRIEDKLDVVSDRLGNIDSTLSAQHVSLKEHMRRTAILERQMEPIRYHVSAVQGILKLITIIAAIVTIIVSFLGISRR